MAVKYWVGGSGTWDNVTTTNWAITSGGAGGTAAPTIADTVNFDSLSGTGTVTVASTATSLSTVQNNANINLSLSGSPTLCSTTGVLNLLAGTITLNNFNLTTGTFNTNNSNTRSISFGTGNIILNASIASAGLLRVDTATGFTYTGTGGFVVSATGTTPTISFGSTAGATSTNAPNITFTGATQTITITSTSSFNNFILNTGCTYTLNNTVNVYGSLTTVTGSVVTGLAVNLLGTGTVTGGSARMSSLTINTSGTITFASTFLCASYTQTLGSVNWASNTLSATSIITYTNGTFSNVGTFTCATWTHDTGAIFTLPLGGTITASSAINITSGSFTMNGTMSSNATFTLTAGTLTLGASMTVGTFSSSNTNIRSIAFSTFTITLNSSTLSAVLLNMAIADNFTYTGTGGFVVSATAVTPTVRFGSTSGATSTNAPNITFTGATQTITITSTSSFNNFILNAGCTYTLNNTINVYGSLTTVTGSVVTGLNVTLAGTGTLTGGSARMGTLFISTSGTITFASTFLCGYFYQAMGSVNFASFGLNASGNTIEWYNGTWTNVGTLTCNAFQADGLIPFTLPVGATLSCNGTITNTSNTFTVNGTISGNPAITQTAGTVNINAAVTTSGTYTLTAGTLTLGANLSVATFSSSNTNIRSIAFSTFNITLNSSTLSAVLLSMAVADNFTYTGTGGFVVSATAVTPTVRFGSTSGATSTNAPNINFTGATQTITITSTSSFNNFIITAGCTYTLNNTINVYGSLTTVTGSVVTGLNVTLAGTGTLTGGSARMGTLFISTSGTITFASTFLCGYFYQAAGSVDFANFGLNASGNTIEWYNGTWTNVGTLTCNAFQADGLIPFTLPLGATLSCNGTITNTSNTFTVNGTISSSAATFILTAGSLVLGANMTVGTFSSSNTNIRSITFSTFNITLTSATTSAVLLSMSTATNFTYTGTGGFVVSATAVTPSIAFGTTGGTSTNAPNITFTGLTSVISITSNSIFNNFILNTGCTYTLNNTINVYGSLTTVTGSVVTGLTVNLLGTGNLTGGSARMGSVTISTSGTITFASTFLCGYFYQAAGSVDFASFGLNASGNTIEWYNGTWTNVGTLTCNTFQADGFIPFTLPVGATLSCTGTITNTSNTFTVNGTISGNPAITQTAGTVNINAAVTTSLSYTLTAGTLNLGANLSVATFISSNSSIRAIAFSTYTITLSSSGVSPVLLSMANATNFTETGTGGFVVSGTPTTTPTIAFGTTGGTSTNAPNITFTGLTSVISITSNSIFNNFILNTGCTYTLSGTITVYGSLTTVTGSVVTSLNVTLAGTGTVTGNTSARMGSLTINNTLGTITFASTFLCGYFYQAAGSVDFANFGLNASGSTIEWYNGTWTNVGTLTCSTFQADGFIPFTLPLGATLTASTAITISSNTFTVNGTITSSPLITLTTGTFTFNGTLTANPSITQTAGTVNINASLTTSGTYTLTAGTLNLGANLSVGTFSSANANIRSIAFSTFNITLASATASAVLLSMATATNFTYTGTGGFVVSATATTPNIAFGSTAGATSTNAPNITFTGLTQTITFTSGVANSSFNNFIINAGCTYTLTNPANIYGSLTTVTGSILTGLAVNLLGTGTVTGTGTNRIGILTIQTSGTITFASTFYCTGYTQTSGSVDFGNFTLNSSGSSIIYTSGTFSNVGTFTCSNWFQSAGATFTLPIGATIQCTGTLTITSGSFTLNGSLTSNPAITQTAGTVTLNSAVTTSGTYTLTAGTLNLGANLSVGTFSSTNANIRSIAFSTYTITLASATTSAILLDMGNANNYTDTGTGGFVVSSTALTPSIAFGSVAGASSTNAPNITFTGTSSVITIAASSFYSSFNNFIINAGCTYTITNPAIIYGSLTTVTGSILTGLTVYLYGTGTVTGTGTNRIGLLTIQTSGTITFASTFYCTGYTQTSGSVDFGNFTLNSSGSTITYTLGTFTNMGTFTCTNWTQSAGATFTLPTGATIQCTGTLTITSGSFTVNGGTITSNPAIVHTAGTVTISTSVTTSNTYTFTAGTLSLGANLSVGIFSSANSNTRSIAFSTNSILLTTTVAATTALDISTATNFSYTGTGGFSAANDVVRNFAFGTTAGGSSTTAVNLTFTGTGTSGPTFTSTGHFKNLNFGPGTATGSFNNAVAVALNIYGNLTLNNATNYSTLNATILGTSTITASSVVNNQLGTTVINASGLTVTLGYTLTMYTLSTLTLIAGTLNLNGFDLSVGIFNSNNTNSRVITFGSNNINLTYVAALTTVLEMSNATNFSWTGTGGFTASNITYTRTYTFGTTGGSKTNAPNLSITSSGVQIQTFTTGSWFNTLSFGTTAFAVPATTLNLNSLTLSTSGTFSSLTATMVSTGTITPNSNATLGTLTINTVSGTTTLAGNLTLTTNATTTLTSGTLDLGNYTLTTGIFSSSNSNTRSIAFGTGNIVLAHTTAATTVLNIATATGFTDTGTGAFRADASVTRTYVFGTTGGNATISPNLSITGSGTAIQTITSGSWFNTLSFSTTAFTLPTTTIYVNTINLSSGGTYTGLTLIMTTPDTGTVDLLGKTITSFRLLSVGTVTLASAVTATGSIGFQMDDGTLDCAGYNITCTGQTCNINSGTNTITNLGTISCSVFQVLTYLITDSGTISATSYFYMSTGVYNYYGGTITTPLVTLTSFGQIILYAALTLPTTCTFNVYDNGGTLSLSGGGLSVGFFTVTKGTLTHPIATVNCNTYNIDLTGTGTALSIPDMFRVAFSGTGGFSADTSVARTYTVGTTAFNSSTSIPPRLSFSGTGIAIVDPTITTNSTFRSLSFNDGLYNNTGISTTNITLYGDLTSNTYSLPNVSFTFSSYLGGVTGNISVNADNSCIIGSTTISATSGTFTLQKNTRINDGSSFTLTSGVFNTNNYSLTTPRFLSTNSNTRTLSLGSSTVYLTTPPASTNSWDFTTTTGLTFNPGTSTIYFQGITSGSNPRTFVGGNKTYYNLYFQNGGDFPTNTVSITGSNTFNNLLNDNTYPITIVFPSGATQTVSNFGLSGASLTNLTTIQSSTTGVQATLSMAAGTVSANYLAIQDINATGGALWTATNSSNLGNNSGWLFISPSNMFLMFN